MDLTRNHFELFSLPQSYALDRDKLDSAYRDMQSAVHPDRFVSRPQAEQRVAMQWATQANEAYQTLRHPVNRGVYLLRLQGSTKREPAKAIPIKAWLRSMR